MKIDIKARFTGAVLFSFEAEINSVRITLEAAVKSKADLREADLRWADLSGADLSGAYLSEADLSGAYLRWADLRGADLSGADLRWADLREADLSGAKNLPIASDDEIARLDQVREIVVNKPERLDMRVWHGSKWDYTHTPEEEHTCGTPHCIAGWLQALSPDESVRKMEPQAAGKLLAPASTYVFAQSNAYALQWLKDRAYAGKPA